ncbi:DNA-methyltransferase [Inediibacterium massiliense]|uniref:DNA-methyltransferase n=1 Tax=Inediibacterium massiliense TaxID=1658111 RepID=UPI0006B46A2F|nr:site-specific DNA-methyltransferase [Inediibacterium massiliense]
MKNTIHINRLYKILGITNNDEAVKVARKLKIPKKQLEYYNNERILPIGACLEKIKEHLNVDTPKLKIMLGIFDRDLIDWLSDNNHLFLEEYNNTQINDVIELRPEFTTENGRLYRSDCIELMQSMDDNSVDTIFADPPFNLSKVYESGIDDNLSEDSYLIWTEKWLLECIRILKPGGALFVYNIPKWLTETAYILNNYLDFRHWIALNFRGYTPPIPNKLNVSHYGLLYYTKGSQVNVFNKQRIPMKTCRHCGGEIHDYGGKKRDVPINGQTISDTWEDIHPVRHKSHKNREENELPLKLLLRVISLTTNEGNIVFDPFGGSGTTYVASELLRRKWIGCEIGSLNPIINRFNNNERDTSIYGQFIEESNTIFINKQRELRADNGFWLPEDYQRE